MEDESANEIDRLADWLTSHGVPPEKVLDCIKYIAGDSEPSNASTPRKE